MTVVNKIKVIEDIEIHIIETETDFRVWAFDAEVGEYIHRLMTYPTYKCPTIALANKKANELAEKQNVSFFI